MASVNYTTIIKKAVDGFNNIQDKLNGIGAKYNGSISVPAASTTNPVSIDALLTSDAFQKATLTASAGVTMGSITTPTKTNITTSTSNTSGVALGLSCTGTPTGGASIDQNGYITKTSVSAGSKKTSTSTVYVTGITLTSGKTFDITVNSKKWTANYDASGNLLFT